MFVGGGEKQLSVGEGVCGRRHSVQYGSSFHSPLISAFRRGRTAIGANLAWFPDSPNGYRDHTAAYYHSKASVPYCNPSNAVTICKTRKTIQDLTYQYLT